MDFIITLAGEILDSSCMKPQIGDHVRFLNEQGGGKVTRIDGHTVYVEDEDGFEIPVLDNDIVVIDDSDRRLQGDAYSRSARDAAKYAPKTRRAAKPLAEGSSWRERINADAEEDDVEEDGEVVVPAKVARRATQADAPKVERYAFDADASDDGDPHFYLALTQSDAGNSGSVDLHVVNDSNYFAHYAIFRTDSKGLSQLMAADTIEPNTKERVDTLNPMQVDGQVWQVQLIMYKKIRTFKAQPVYNVEVRPRAARMLRDGSFGDNDFFDQRAMLLPVIKDEFAVKLEQLTEREARKGASEGRKEESPKVSRPSRSSDLIEVDLHIGALLPDTRGLDNRDMLEAQMAHVRSVMEANVRRQGLRIVFIHGVGAGVLKSELRRYLERKYPKCHYQDASFHEYGFGATMVTIG